MLSLAAPSRADWKFVPQVELRETYTDNVALRPVGQANWVTELAPGFTLDNSGPRLQFRGSYTKRFYEYSDRAIGGVHGNQQQLAADARAKLVQDLLFLDASANISQRAASAFGPQLIGIGNGFASANADEVKTIRVSPYLLHRFGAYATAELRYARDYLKSENASLGQTDGNTTTLNLNSGAAFRQLGWGLYASHDRQDNEVAGKSNSDNAMATLRYLLTPLLSLTAGAGYDRYDYASLGGSTQGRAWSLGFKWEPGARTSVTANMGRRYYGDSYSLQAFHRSRATVWTLNYNDAVTTTRAQFMLPSTVDTASLLDRMFAATIADPVARRQAVDAYIQATGLPASIANNINYFSNRYMLQKQLQAAMALNLAHTTLLVTLADARRSGLSATEVDSGLLGSATSTLNDNTRQTSASAALNWRLNSRTAVNVNADVARIRSVSQDRTDHNRSLRVGLSHALRPKLRAGLDLRRIRGGNGVGLYTENAISASITKQF